jgi:hypothetical protein
MNKRNQKWLATEEAPQLTPDIARANQTRTPHVIAVKVVGLTPWSRCAYFWSEETGRRIVHRDRYAWGGSLDSTLRR